jgi:hypothetical protein
MNPIPDDHALDRLLESLDRFNRQQTEEQKHKPALDGADALISRTDAFTRRQNEAATLLPPTAPPEPSHTPQAAENFDDLPVLTDIVHSTPHAEASPALDIDLDFQNDVVCQDFDEAFTLPAGFDNTPPKVDKAVPTLGMERLRNDIIQALRARLDIEIPTLIEAALQGALPGIIEEIRLGLEENVQAALRDLTSPH